MKIINYTQGSDLPFGIKFRDYNGAPLDLSTCKYSIILFTDCGGGYVKVIDGVSQGTIECNTVGGLGVLHVRCKSSAVLFGKGPLKMRLRLAIPNPDFEGGWQVLVFKSLRDCGGGFFEAETNLVIV